MLPRVLAACAGFLLAVLWMDLMFDLQVRRHAARTPLPAPVRASIAAYYRRVTTDAGGMRHLIGAVMLVTVAGATLEALGGRGPLLLRLAALALAVVPTGLAVTRTFPYAVALGAAAEPPERASTLARAILRDHCLAFAAMAAFLALQLRA
jgi:hypothetical protein